MTEELDARRLAIFLALAFGIAWAGAFLKEYLAAL